MDGWSMLSNRSKSGDAHCSILATNMPPISRRVSVNARTRGDAARRVTPGLEDDGVVIHHIAVRIQHIRADFGNANVRNAAMRAGSICVGVQLDVMDIYVCVFRKFFLEDES